MTAQSHEEIYLLGCIAREDRRALAQLYDRYARVLFAFALKIVASREEAEEVVLDVFERVWKTAASYDPKKGRVDTWLFTIARSRSIDKLRAKKRQGKLAEASEQNAQAEASTSPEPLEDAMVRERRQQVLEALAKLPPEQRHAIELAYYQGLSRNEIAAQTGHSAGTVATRIRLGLNKLRQYLDEAR
ncbi:sigma-70 family RNA polymerase sigma factor [Oscillatoria sp. FACHB-1406]|uniref:sigma-70 family RNA polymerase sigma factor n=1 Tax=Oscillatoria sp. FACHB-1406 TaxID=2692846 RepID=UPI0016825E45|nr:sigma-70 family RNA polymerase sigma factor [Oscillatoria sp. FACHB-1406]MBD2577397.1 sigma-70 family RNA polymerase sigma factor [Oscillatoria sp. FACHB-1406]